MSAPSRTSVTMAAPPWIMSREADIPCQKSPLGDSFKASARSQMTPVTNRTEKTPYRPQRNRSSSRKADGILPVRCNPDIPGLQNEECTCPIALQKALRRFARDHDHLGQRVGDHTAGRTNGRPDDAADRPLCHRIKDRAISRLGELQQIEGPAA